MTSTAARAEGLTEGVRTRCEVRCHVCGSEGETLYTGLRDRLFGAPGEWTMRRCPCPDCGLLWLDPMPMEEDLPKLYREYFTHGDVSARCRTGVRSYIETAYLKCNYAAHRDHSFRTALLASLLKLAPGHRAQADLKAFSLDAKSAGRLLDVGCGNGAGLLRLRSLGWTVEGIDFDAEAVKQARRHDLNVNVGTLEERAYPDESFDAVVMSHVLEHVPDPRALIAESWRIIKPGGALVCVTPNAQSAGHQKYGAAWLHLDPPRHLMIFSKSSMRKLAEGLGLTAYRVETSIANYHFTEMGSRSIRSSGLFNMVSSRLYERVRGRLRQYAIALGHSSESGTGEELVLRAIKQ